MQHAASLGLDNECGFWEKIFTPSVSILLLNSLKSLFMAEFWTDRTSLYIDGYVSKHMYRVYNLWLSFTKVRYDTAKYNLPTEGICKFVWHHKAFSTAWFRKHGRPFFQKSSSSVVAFMDGASAKQQTLKLCMAGVNIYFYFPLFLPKRATKYLCSYAKVFDV